MTNNVMAKRGSAVVTAVVFLALASCSGETIGNATGVAGTTGRGGTPGAAGTPGGAGTGSVAGTSGAAGTTGRGGTTGAAGAIGRGGATAGAGTTGRGGTTGAAGTTGRGGTTGAAGTSGAAGTTGRGGTSGAAGTTGAAGAGATGGAPAGLLDPTRTTTWNPGILTDGQLQMPLGPDGLPVRTTVCATPAPGADLNAAIKTCPEGQVVKLAAGTYTVSATVTLNKGVVLRGAGSGGASKGGTTIVKTGGNSVLAIGTGQDTACYASAFAAAVALSADAVKETGVVTVGANAAKFAPGDIALIDEVDDAPIMEGDCMYFKRVDKRSVSERVEVAAVDTGAGTITLASPLHWTFRSASPHLAQIAKLSQPVVRWAGIESLAIQGGANPGYNGQMAGGIDVSNAAYSWIKDVQTDGSIGGMHVALTGAYRTVVRDSHFHNSATYGFGTDCYGIVLRCGAADNLVENNIARYMNKPILFNVSGGGNVIGYNYADNSWATPPAWQEVNIDTHCSFPHMELIEGNYAPHMGATTTHGNAGYMTFFRNYSSSQFAPPAVYGSTDLQNGNVTALDFPKGDIAMTVIGNVFGSASAGDLRTAAVSSVYVGTGSSASSIVLVDSKTDVAYTSLVWHGNYDTVNKAVMWSPSIAARTLPASLYRAGKPAWWPAANPWPWSGSDQTPMVGTLPAKARSDALGM